jgi:hypothetical protein
LERIIVIPNCLNNIVDDVLRDDHRIFHRAVVVQGRVGTNESRQCPDGEIDICIVVVVAQVLVLSCSKLICIGALSSEDISCWNGESLPVVYDLSGLISRTDHLGHSAAQNEPAPTVFHSC